MNGSSGHPYGETLGACIASLGPGDACPWCGARLTKVAGSGPGRQLALLSGFEPAGDEALRCPECGCEVVVEEEPAETTGCRTFSAAA
jgi:DNA-directed RNA polymerase subunit RPC12/RpoP